MTYLLSRSTFADPTESSVKRLWYYVAFHHSAFVLSLPDGFYVCYTFLIHCLRHGRVDITSDQHYRARIPLGPKFLPKRLPVTAYDPTFFYKLDSAMLPIMSLRCGQVS